MVMVLAHPLVTTFMLSCSHILLYIHASCIISVLAPGPAPAQESAPDLRHMPHKQATGKEQVSCLYKLTFCSFNTAAIKYFNIKVHKLHLVIATDI